MIVHDEAGNWYEAVKLVAHDHICLRSGCMVECDVLDCTLADENECKELCVPCVAANLIDELEEDMEEDMDA